MNSITDKVNSHDVKLARIEAVLERVAINQDKLSDSQSTLIVAVGKMEVILEKVNNLEDSTNESSKRIHNRIDAIENKVESLDIFITITKYPKLALLILLGIFLFSIKEIRDVVIAWLGV